jgi:hypothetical protein
VVTAAATLARPDRRRRHAARASTSKRLPSATAELSVAEFVNRSVCSECGARWPNISISLESLLASLGDCAGAAGKSAADMIAAQDKPAFIYHLGDWDPSGQNAADKIEETLRALAPDAEIEFRKLAVTPMQIDQWRLPSRPTKASDSRTRNWTGGDSVELDAIHPDDLRDIVRAAIERHIEEEKLAKLRIAEESERELLKAWRPNGAARP